MRKNLRGMVAFGAACATSPCCTPFLVPIILTVLAGTPVAFGITHNFVWVYGGLTAVSIIGFVLAYRWLWHPAAKQPHLVRPIDIPTLPIVTGDNQHANPK